MVPTQPDSRMLRRSTAELFYPPPYSGGLPFPILSSLLSRRFSPENFASSLALSPPPGFLEEGDFVSDARFSRLLHPRPPPAGQPLVSVFLPLEKETQRKRPYTRPPPLCRSTSTTALVVEIYTHTVWPCSEAGDTMALFSYVCVVYFRSRRSRIPGRDSSRPPPAVDELGRPSGSPFQFVYTKVVDGETRTTASILFTRKKKEKKGLGADYSRVVKRFDMRSYCFQFRSMKLKRQMWPVSISAWPINDSYMFMDTHHLFCYEFIDMDFTFCCMFAAQFRCICAWRTAGPTVLHINSFVYSSKKTQRND